MQPWRVHSPVNSLIYLILLIHFCCCPLVVCTLFVSAFVVAHEIQTKSEKQRENRYSTYAGVCTHYGSERAKERERPNRESKKCDNYSIKVPAAKQRDNTNTSTQKKAGEKKMRKDKENGRNIYGGDLYLNSFSCLLSPTEKFSSVMRYNFFLSLCHQTSQTAVQAPSQRVSQPTFFFVCSQTIFICLLVQCVWCAVC